MSSPHEKKLLDALKFKRLYLWEKRFWRAVGGTAKRPSLIEICPVAESGFRAKVDKNGCVVALLLDGKGRKHAE